MTQLKARMDQLTAVLAPEREQSKASTKRKDGNKVLRKSEKRTIARLDLNPPHGEKEDFEKVTVTLPGPIRRLLLDEAHRRKVEKDPNWSISVIVREALASYLGGNGKG